MTSPGSRRRSGRFSLPPSGSFRVLHTVKDSLSEMRKADREELAEDLKAVYRADTVEQAHDALKVLEERWAGRYPDLVAKWLRKSYALLEFMSHPKAIQPYLYTTNQLERLMKEVKRRTKVVEVFCGPEAWRSSYTWC